MPTKSYALVLALLAFAWASTAGEAGAQGDRRARREARAHFEQATQHYNLGRFDEALAEYTRSYELFPSPLLLFNIGQCHRSLGNHERAVFFLESFLREAENATSEQRELVEQLLLESNAALNAQRAPPPEETDPSEERSVPTPEEAARTEIVPTGDPERDTPRAPQVYEEGWFWAVIVLAVAAVGVGIGVGVWAGTQTQLPSGSLGYVDWRPQP